MSGHHAFVATTAFLTFLPLAMVAALGWWLRSRARRMSFDFDESSERQDD